MGAGLLARLAAYCVLLLGFWWLYQGFMEPNVLKGLLGGAAVLGGMWLLVSARRGAGESSKSVEEDKPGDDSLD